MMFAGWRRYGIGLAVLGAVITALALAAVPRRAIPW